jgi:diguanylate cyclase (GGDEF)-like protein
MKPTELSLLDQLRITEPDVKRRFELLAFTEDDCRHLREHRPCVEAAGDAIIDRFYQHQLGFPEVALLIGDADTLAHLRGAQRRYILGLFSGQYGLEYANNRLRIGLVHKRIGVGPRLYLAAVHALKGLLGEEIVRDIADPARRAATLAALEKLLVFDISLVFEMSIWGMVSEIAAAKEKSDRYALELEDTVRQRTRQLEYLMRTDPLTGLSNARSLDEMLIRSVRAAERRAEPISVIFFDLDGFKEINDTHGHLRGDQILGEVGAVVKRISRAEDGCFRYGGDEFCIVLPNCVEERARDIYFERLKAGLRQLPVEVSASIGVAQTGPDEFLDPLDLLRLADQRMYEAKKGGRRADRTP